MEIRGIGKIKKIQIIYPNKPLTQWYAEQTDKPDILFNASLYSGSEPCGTVIKNGAIVHNEGTGMGFGIKNGVPSFGTPWDNWNDYFTGYNSYIQNGKFVSPAWRDSYVFEASLTRIAIGKKNNEWIVCTGTGSLASNWNGAGYNNAGTFAQECLNNGISDICGLDGGGSRCLLYMGNWIYTSTRTPYNAIAIWVEDKLTIKAQSRINTCTINGTPELNRYIDINDVCTINKALIEIEYPISNGTRTAYIKIEDLFNFIKV